MTGSPKVISLWKSKINNSLGRVNFPLSSTVAVVVLRHV